MRYLSVTISRTAPNVDAAQMYKNQDNCDYKYYK